MLRQFSIYALAGFIGTAVHYLVLVGLVDVVGLGVVVSTCIGAALGAIINYVLNYRFTFVSNRSHSVTFRRYFTLAGFSWCLNGALMSLLIQTTAFHYLLLQVAVTVVVSLSNFVASRYWVFCAEGEDRRRNRRLRHWLEQRLPQDERLDTLKSMWVGRGASHID